MATLGGTIAYEILLRAEREHGLTAVSYDDDVHPYSDLLLGRVDAVLLDHVLANRRQRTMPGLTTQPGTVAVGHYVGVLAPRDGALRDRIDDILRDAMRDGTLERIFRKWNVWNEDQPALYAKLLAGEQVPPVIDVSGDRGNTYAGTTPLSGWDAARLYLPSLIRASGITLLLSCLAMAVAVAPACSSPRARVRRTPAAGRSSCLRGTDARDAAAAAAVRALLRNCGSDPAAGVHGRPARAGAELRGLRKRDLSVGAPGGSRAVNSRRRARWG